MPTSPAALYTAALQHPCTVSRPHPIYCRVYLLALAPSLYSAVRAQYSSTADLQCTDSAPHPPSGPPSGPLQGFWAVQAHLANAVIAVPILPEALVAKVSGRTRLV